MGEDGHFLCEDVVFGGESWYYFVEAMSYSGERMVVLRRNVMSLKEKFSFGEKV